MTNTTTTTPLDFTRMGKTRQGIVVNVHNATYRTFDDQGFTLKTCPKCGGVGYLAGFEHSDGARCWGCNGNGYRYTPKTLLARQEFVAAVKRRETVDIAAAWKAAGSKVEADVAEYLINAYAERNARIAARTDA